MQWFTAAVTVAMLAPAVFLATLMRRLRKAGRPDRAGERILWFWISYVVARALLLEACPGTPPTLLVLGSVVPLLLVCFGLLAVRVRRNPEALFSPATIARARAAAVRLRGTKR